jgi:hypothetical protein
MLRMQFEKREKSGETPCRHYNGKELPYVNPDPCMSSQSNCESFVSVDNRMAGCGELILVGTPLLRERHVLVFKEREGSYFQVM